MPSKRAKLFKYIFETWLPNSEYALDNRAQLEVLGEKYKNGSPDSEEEIWAPVKSRIYIHFQRLELKIEKKLPDFFINEQRQSIA